MLTFILITAATVAFAAVALTNLPAAVALIAALLPTYLVRFNVGPLPSTLLEALLLVLFAVWLFKRGRAARPFLIPPPLQPPILLLLIGATVGVLISPDLRGALGIWRAYFVEPLLYFVVFLDTIKTAEHRRNVLAAFASITIVIGLTAIYQKITGFSIPNPFWQAEATRRVTSFYGFPNAIGLFLAPILPLMAGWLTDLVAIRGKKSLPLSLLPSLALVLGALAIFFAVSEGALIGAAAALLIFALLYRPFRAAALLAIIIGTMVVSSYRPALNYASGIFGMSDDSTSVRAIVWKESVAMLADHPVFGAGLNAYQKIFAPYHLTPGIEIFMYPHDVFLNFWTETGLIGLVAFIWIVVMALKNCIVLVKRGQGTALPAALLGAFVALLIHGLVDVPFFKNDLAILFWILIALAQPPSLDRTTAVGHTPPTR